LGFCFYQLLTRILAAHDSPTTSNFYAGLCNTLAMSALVPFFWEVPRWDHALLMLALGGFGMTAHLLLTQAFRHAAPALLAPFSYCQIVFAGLLGFVVVQPGAGYLEPGGHFGDLPQWAGGSVDAAAQVRRSPSSRLAGHNCRMRSRSQRSAGSLSWAPLQTIDSSASVISNGAGSARSCRRRPGRRRRSPAPWRSSRCCAAGRAGCRTAAPPAPPCGTADARQVQVDVAAHVPGERHHRMRAAQYSSRVSGPAVVGTQHLARMSRSLRRLAVAGRSVV
jgi:hypothetical protein